VSKVSVNWFGVMEKRREEKKRKEKRGVKTDRKTMQARLWVEGREKKLKQ